MKTSVIAAASLTLLCGCFSMGHPVKQDNLAKIKWGQTTRAEVETLLGKPETVSFVDGPEGKRTVLVYIYSYSAVKGTTFIPYAGAFMGGVNTSVQNTTIVLDTNNVVLNINSSNSAIGTGNALEAMGPGDYTNSRTSAAPMKPSNR